MKKEVVKKTSTATKKKETVERAEETKVIQLSEVELLANQLKEEHGEVFVTNIAGVQIIWRKLKRSEYKEIMSTKFDDNEDIQYFERQDAMAKKVILYPENVDRLLEDYAGVSDIIATETMIKTGFGIANTKAVK
ncbi:MAG: hypothetical protein J6D47_09780 [Peptostreptococcaceae bacterium]|nr:hypothetical protein [Peptostreptococcaceae bacterium]